MAPHALKVGQDYSGRSHSEYHDPHLLQLYAALPVRMGGTAHSQTAAHVQKGGQETPAHKVTTIISKTFHLL